MSRRDGPPQTVSLFGKSFTVSENGTIQITHTMTVEQARSLEENYIEATNLQQALVMACEDGIKLKNQRVTSADFEGIECELRKLRKAKADDSDQ
jgi:hypothetical protein